MDYGGGSRTVQEQEIIEHYVTECRRTAPVVNQMDFIDGNGILHMSTAERSYEEQTFSPGFRSNESFMLSSNIGDDTDRRWLLYAFDSLKVCLISAVISIGSLTFLWLSSNFVNV